MTCYDSEETMDAEIKAEFQKVGERFDSLETRFDGLVKQMRDLEAILGEFHKWASPMEHKLRAHTCFALAHDQEIADLKDRVKALERKAS
ncbi:MAG: hypothetical protein JWO80_2285 [Bryobacterales bacterium]|nr:hypothetical protein [Bryobacterales bacterium]